MASGDHNSAENLPGRSATAGAGVRHSFIQCDLMGFARELRDSGQGSPIGDRQAYRAAWGELPPEERKQLNSADDWAERLRTTRPAVWRAYLEDFAKPIASLRFYRSDLARIRLLMREFGMSFPDLPPPAFPDPADYGITDDIYWTVKRAHRPTDHPTPTAEERQRLTEYGTALMRVASWHAIADLPGIPEHKLTIDTSTPAARRYCGWTIRPIECTAALRIWRSLVEKYGEATLMRRVANELETELWAGWLIHLDNATRHAGLHVVGNLDAWSTLHKLHQILANDS